LGHVNPAIHPRFFHLVAAIAAVRGEIDPEDGELDRVTLDP
jgi:hypothetical protein